MGNQVYQWRSRLRSELQTDLARESTLSSSPSGFVDLGVLGGDVGGWFQVRLDLGGRITLTLARG